jgi:ATPase subunit of ABC transporter with duplicated ATPase domains
MKGDKMIDIAVKDLNKYYGSNHVIKGISFEINRGDKVGLAGRNGSGKSTLLKIIAGLEDHESGNVIRASGTRVEILEQIPSFDEGSTVDNVLHSAFDDISEIFDEMRSLEIRIAACAAAMQSGQTGERSTAAYGQRGDSDERYEKLLSRYGRLQTIYEAKGGYEVESRIDRVCTGMKIDAEMREKQFALLSGGEQTRVNLARILLKDADILLLDEPTNHLDLGSIQWVEEFLGEFGGTVLVISHDRCFLDNVVKSIIELDSDGVSFYEGNYSFYAEERVRRFNSQLEKYEQQKRKIDQLEAAAKRLHEWARVADSGALHKRAFAIEKRIERMERVEKPAAMKKITAGFRENGHTSEDTVVFKDICKAYGSRTLLNGIDLIIRRNDRVALIGANGCGKSTLIRILTGEETPDQGHVKIGNSIRPAYLPQVIEFENNTATVLETVRYALETNEERARKILARFHFRGSDVQKMTGNLSGGEKSRLKLCLLMQQDINLLILDEPTNHLDIQSREWIEEALSGYGGTILFVSHDRYFINKFADRVWELKDGSITDFDGTYAEYCQWLSMTANREKAAPYGRDAAKGAVRNADPGSTASREGNKADLSRKTSREGNGEEPGWKVSREANEEDLSRNASRKGNRPGRDRRGNENSSIRKASEIKVCEEKIGLAELRLSRLNEEMETSASDFEKLNELFAQKKEIEDELDQLYSKWGELTC